MNRLVVRWAAILALFALLAVLRVRQHYPVFPRPLTVDLLLDRGEAGRADPVIVAGRTDTGDFLTVRFDDERTVRFIYDSWGFPGLPSQPVAIRPGEKLRLQIDMPALDQIQGGWITPKDRIRVHCNGALVLDTEVHFYPREPDRIFFGENSLGGTACGRTLRGVITDTTGRVLRHGPASFFSSGERVLDWLRVLPHQALLLLIASVATVRFVERRVLAGSAFRTATSWTVRHRVFVSAMVVATFGYSWLVTLGSFQFGHGEVFGSFYDYQALSFLQGRLDVPEEAIAGEAFEARGKLYGYFGPTPALLRLPFVLTGFAFAKLSRAFMVAYFVGCLLAAYAIFRHALALARAQSVRETVPSALATIVLVASVGWGSTIFFLGSRGLIFHEAILGGIVFALWSCWFSLRHLAAPAGRWWIGALICGVLSVHTRPPTGLFALTFLGCISVFTVLRAWRETPGRAALVRRHGTIAILCLVGFVSLNALAWLKFRTFDAAPLRISRPYAEPGRLERIDGKSFHLVNIPFNFDTYVVRPNFRVEAGFPWVYLGSLKPRRSFPRAKMDLPDFTLAVPYAMPSLFLLSTLGCAAAWFVRPELRWAMAGLWLAVLPMSLALFAAIASSQRYTGDFCPFLITAGCVGLAAVETLRSVVLRGGARTVLVFATAAAVAVTIAITLHYQGETLWGVPDHVRDRYQAIRRRVDGFFGVDGVASATPIPAEKKHLDR
jgi:hypothetical protein